VITLIPSGEYDCTVPDALANFDFGFGFNTENDGYLNGRCSYRTGTSPCLSRGSCCVSTADPDVEPLFEPPFSDLHFVDLRCQDPRVTESCLGYESEAISEEGRVTQLIYAFTFHTSPILHDGEHYPSGRSLLHRKAKTHVADSDTNVAETDTELNTTTKHFFGKSWSWILTRYNSQPDTTFENEVNLNLRTVKKKEKNIF